MIGGGSLLVGPTLLVGLLLAAGFGPNGPIAGMFEGFEIIPAFLIKISQGVPRRGYKVRCMVHTYRGVVSSPVCNAWQWWEGVVCRPRFWEACLLQVEPKSYTLSTQPIMRRTQRKRCFPRNWTRCIDLTEILKLDEPFRSKHRQNAYIITCITFILQFSLITVT